MLSPAFRVREFKVEDVTPYPIRLFWRTLSEGAMDDTDSAIIIPKKSPLPAPKVVSFARTQPIQFTAKYEEPQSVPAAGLEGYIGTYSILTVPAPSNAAEKPVLKVKARLDINGTFAVGEAEMSETVEETVEVEEPVPPPASSTPAAASPTPAQAPSDGAQSPKPDESQAPAQTQAPAPVPAPVPAKPGESDAAAEKQPAKTRKRTEVRKKVITKSLVVKREGLGLAKGLLQTFIEEEGKMQAADKLAHETAHAKNALESYQYGMRDKLSANNELSKYGLPEDVKRLSKMLEETRDWLYGDGESQSKSVYVERLKALQAVGDPICFRKAEADGRPVAFRDMESALYQWEAFPSTTDEKYSHIELADRDKISARCKEVREWLVAQRKAQDALPLHANPTATVAAIVSKQKELVEFCTPIMNKPKPPPPKPAEPAEKSSAASATTAAGAATATSTSNPETPTEEKQQPPPIPTSESPAAEKMNVDK
jgi:hypothetical protein